MKKMIFIFLGVFLFFLPPVQADFPEREITIYVGSTAGGTTDLCIRFISEYVSKELGQPIVVVNKPGASHTVAANLVAHAKPDGYTLGATTSSPFDGVPLLRKVPYDPLKDFTWIATYGEYQSGYVVRPDAPWKNIEEFLDYAKKNPGKITYTSDGYGMADHLCMEYMAWKRDGIKWKFVPIPGGPNQASALLGGHVNFWAAGGYQVQFIRDGAMRLILAFNNRMPECPAVPTFQEVFKTHWRTSIFMILSGPKGIPDPIRKKLESAFLKSMKLPANFEFFKKLGYPPSFYGSEETGPNIETQRKIWAEMIKATGVKIEQ
jgi:tripartite-type tricarboxylate transporter receptor subunit TctC